MLFDLEDYVTSGILGFEWETYMDLIDNGVVNKWGNPVNGGDLEDPHTTARATKDAFMKAAREYYYAGRVWRSAEEGKIAEFDTWYMQLNDAQIDLGFAWNNFWSAVVSIPYLGGRNGGEEAFANNHSELTFTVMTQEIYDEYRAKLTVIISLVKDLFVLVEGAPIIE
jgi:hypothetical protein